jgi:hypothetical protein
LTGPFPRKLQMFGAFEPDTYVDCTSVLLHSFYAGIRENYSEYDRYSFTIARPCGRIPFLRYLVRQVSLHSQTRPSFHNMFHTVIFALCVIPKSI